MSSFETVFAALEQQSLSNVPPITISGIGRREWPFFFHHILHNTSISDDSVFLFVCETPETSSSLFYTLRSLKEIDVLSFPGLERSPFSGILASEGDLFRRFHVLDKLAGPRSRPTLIIADTESMSLKIPPPSFFAEKRLLLSLSDVIGPEELARQLLDMGHLPAPSVDSPGTFSKKGEIFDIHPISGPPIRIHYFDEMIEEIFAIDPQSGRTDRAKPLASASLGPAPWIFRLPEYASRLRSNLPMPSPKFKNRYEERKRILNKISEGTLFENFAVCAPLFLEKTSVLIDHLTIATSRLVLVESFRIFENARLLMEDLEGEFKNASLSTDNDCVLPGPEAFYSQDWIARTDGPSSVFLNTASAPGEQIDLDLPVEPASLFMGRHIVAPDLKFKSLKHVLDLLRREFSEIGNVTIATTNSNAQKEFRYFLDANDFSPELRQRITFLDLDLEEGFFFSDEHFLVLAESDLFGPKIPKTRRTVSLEEDVFAEQLSTLQLDDFVVHADYGIGRYKGLQALDVGGPRTDFLLIHYADGDKIYVPVYKMNLIQKHADASAAIKIDSIRTNSFRAARARAKKSAKTLAFDLVKLNAERQVSQAWAFSPPDHLFREFELSFPFKETPDQASAIEDVIADMIKPVPMDRLVCGDVGFGKTEVAMRAAFKAVCDNKQVAVLVPTTVLALQHFNTFTARFKNFPVRIEQISRLKTAVTVKKTKEDLKNGKIDIIIGTHMLLAKDIAFKDLGLLIIDEEQRFGVSHKERMKLYKTSVDILTLTATPIPRTMQLAFLGLRDLSLIHTAPPNRQSIKTYLIKEDPQIIKEAIEMELDRGGQIFYVHNRIEDIELAAVELKKIVPRAKLVMAHGQLPERELEKRMQAFYAGDFDVLLCTTIIESGTDIPRANTLVVDRADRFGLSQLHQLRGRIGRSDRKAYAYFTIPKGRELTNVAEKRLAALQTYAEMGQGFSIASTDLEIRGAGDILGAEQSGQIEAIGLELYLELLKEAIGEIKGEKNYINQDIEFKIPEPAFIPTQYIQDPAIRLKYYKKLSGRSSHEELAALTSEITDIFGQAPVEFVNLVTLLGCRLHLSNRGIKSVACAGHSIVISFDPDALAANPPLRDKVVQTFLARPKLYQITPDYKVCATMKQDVTLAFLEEFAKGVAAQIVP
jgi:transcription-repair coupling factor (superfamily II helicase)